jgi:hypothetical protein
MRGSLAYDRRAQRILRRWTWPGDVRRAAQGGVRVDARGERRGGDAAVAVAVAVAVAAAAHGAAVAVAVAVACAVAVGVGTGGQRGARW